MAYRAERYSHLKPQGKEERRRVAAEEKNRLNELKRIEREWAEAQDDSILKGRASELAFLKSLRMNKAL
ncbi:hypothetical protein U0070_007640 [Myodes glareolus]|uniref:Uncharacterized protein n=1 Tax=Myodes glareolus TaxID=447135 RepID=A0AAW0IZJ2_MYOGA